MNEITNIIYNFREAARGLWNNHYQRLDDSEFEPVEEWLFKTLVMNRCEPYVEHTEYDEDYFASISVIPEFGPKGTTVMWARQNKNSWVWSEIKLKREDIDLKFMYFFDWKQYEFRDFQYARAKILSCPELPEIEGAEMLIEANMCRYYKV